MKIKNIKKIGTKPVYDITVGESHEYVLENGVVTHNTGVMYSADNVWIVGRQQEKTGTEITGYNFVINIEKSRFVKEKSKIPISVSFDRGIQKWSGFLELALEAQYIGKPANGWYQVVDRETGELVGQKYRQKDIENNGTFWKELLTNTDFGDYIKNRYSLGVGVMLHEEESVNIPESE